MSWVSRGTGRAVLGRREVVRRRGARLVAVSSVKPALVVSRRRGCDGRCDGAVVPGRRRRVVPRSHLTRVRVSVIVRRRNGVLVVRSERGRVRSWCGTGTRVFLCRRLTAAAAVEEGGDGPTLHTGTTLGTVERKRGRGMPTLRVLRFDVELEGHVNVERRARRAGGGAACRGRVAVTLGAAVGVQKCGEGRKRCDCCCCWSHGTEMRGDGE